MRVLVAMSGGVDSSVAAALLVEQGHEVVGATLKLWGGAQDGGCCSVGDVEDARRVAQQLGIVHHVFNFGDDFENRVVAPYVEDHAAGRTPNPCIECNRHVKFDRLLKRAIQLGFDALATGHHARVESAYGEHRLYRGADRAKDQSYVLFMLGQQQLARVHFPVGQLTKSEVRRRAAALGLRTAAKPDSQDTCFITANGGRRGFLGARIPLHSGRVIDAATGAHLGDVAAVELVTIGQRRGLGLGGGDRRYALGVDVAGGVVVVGGAADLHTDRVDTVGWTWVGSPLPDGSEVCVQTSAHGPALPATLDGAGLKWKVPQRRVAPGQAVVLFDASTAARVMGGAPAC